LVENPTARGVYPMVQSIFGMSGMLFFELKRYEVSCNYFYYRTEKEWASMDDVHEGMIWNMFWKNPLSHILFSGSNDHTTFVSLLLKYELIYSFFLQFRRFWARNRPGDIVLGWSEVGVLLHASRLKQKHREELEHERVFQEINLPDLGIKDGLFEPLQKHGKLIEKKVIRFSSYLGDTHNRRETAGISGLKFSNEDEESRRRYVGFFPLFLF
jgi:hypothetical protein